MASAIMKKNSFEPESNQRPKDYCFYVHYSPPLYQLSYRRKDEKGRRITIFKLQPTVHSTPQEFGFAKKNYFSKITSIGSL